MMTTLWYNVPVQDLQLTIDLLDSFEGDSFMTGVKLYFFFGVVYNQNKSVLAVYALKLMCFFMHMQVISIL